MPCPVLKKKYLKYRLSFCLRRSSRGCMAYSIFAYWFKSWWHGNKVSAWRNEKNEVFIISVALCGMISSRGVQYLYHLPRFCWQYFFQGGLDNIMRIRHPMLLNHRFNHLPLMGEVFHLKEYISSLQVNYWHICLEGSVLVWPDVRHTSQNYWRTYAKDIISVCTYLY